MLTEEDEDGRMMMTKGEELVQPNNLADNQAYNMKLKNT